MPSKRVEFERRDLYYDETVDPRFLYERAIKATETSMERLGVDYIDLMLLHQPMGDYINAWKGLEKLLQRWQVEGDWYGKLLSPCTCRSLRNF